MGSVSLTNPAIAVAAAFLGLFVGSTLRRRMQAALFQRALYAIFTLLGLVMVAKTL